MRWIVVAFAVFTLGSWSTRAAAWGDSAHRIVCEIAVRNLTPAASAEVSRLLQARPTILSADPRHAEYGWACTYADRPMMSGPGRRGPEHFVIYSRTTMTVTSATACGVSPICVVSAIAADLAVLRDRSKSDSDRAWALVYLGHWLADSHSPLHHSFSDDQGGNQLDSRGRCALSLHSTWDTCILQARHLGSTASVEAVRALAADWTMQTAAVDRRLWLATQPWQWSAESYAETLRPEMGYCVMVGQACQYSATQAIWAERQPKRSVQIDDAYMNWAMPVIQRRLTQAGVRLAHLLNQSLDPAYRG